MIFFVNALLCDDCNGVRLPKPQTALLAYSFGFETWLCTAVGRNFSGIFFFFFHDILTGLQHLSLVSYSLLYLLNLVQLVPSRTFSPQQIPLPQPKHTTRDWCHWSSRKVQKTLPPNCFHTKLVSGSKCSILHFVCSVFSCSFSCISVSAAPPVVSRGVLA